MKGDFRFEFRNHCLGTLTDTGIWRHSTQSPCVVSIDRSFANILTFDSFSRSFIGHTCTSCVNHLKIVWMLDIPIWIRFIVRNVMKWVEIKSSLIKRFEMLWTIWKIEKNFDNSIIGNVLFLKFVKIFLSIDLYSIIFVLLPADRDSVSFSFFNRLWL